MEYLWINVKNVYPKYIVGENKNREGYKFFTLEEDIYLENKEYQIYIYSNIKIDHNNNVCIDRFAFLHFHSLQLFKFLVSIKGIGPKWASKIINSAGNPNYLLEALNRNNALEISGINIKHATLIIDFMRKKKNKNLIAALMSLSCSKGIKSEALWILQEMELEREKCVDIIENIDKEMKDSGIELGVEKMKVEELVKEVLSRNSSKFHIW